MKMSRPSMSQLLRAAEVIYAIAALFALTQGPIYQIWSESAASLSTSPQPSMPHVYFATFVGVQLPALVLLARRLSTDWLRDRRVQALLALHIWLGLSVVWSTLARHSLPEYVSLLLTSSTGFFLASSFSPNTFWKITAAAMSLGVLSSLWAIIWEWELSTSVEEGYWIGIYYNRNSLAPVAAVALVASVGVMLTEPSKKTGRSRVMLLVATILIPLSVVMLWKAESKTSPLALGIALSALVVWMFIRWISSKIATDFKSAASLTSAVGGFALFFVLQEVGKSTIVSRKTATFNSRGDFWSLSWTGFLERPLHGWGWMSAWHTPQFFEQGKWWKVYDNVSKGLSTTWAHSGYHDLLLGGGVVAAACFALVVWFGMQAVGSRALLREAIPNFLIVQFVLVAATQESFFIGTHFLWAILVTGLLLPFNSNSMIRRKLVQEQNSDEFSP